MYHSFTKISQKHEADFSADNNNKNVSWAPDQHIRTISEESCQAESWSNDAEKSALTSH